jgi:hypothetical protein
MKHSLYKEYVKFYVNMANCSKYNINLVMDPI